MSLKILFDIINNVTITIHVQNFVWTYIFISLGVEFLDHMACLHFEENSSEFSICKIKSFAGRGSFTSYYLNWINFIYFDCLISLARTSNKMLNWSDKSWLPCFVTNFSVNAFSFMMKYGISCYFFFFFVDAWGYPLLFLVCCMVFYLSWKEFFKMLYLNLLRWSCVLFLCSSNTVHYIDWFSYSESDLYYWDKSHLFVVCKFFLYVDGYVC